MQKWMKNQPRLLLSRSLSMTHFSTVPYGENIAVSSVSVSNLDNIPTNRRLSSSVKQDNLINSNLV